MKLSELAERIGGEVSGDPEIEITGVGGLEDASPGEITLLRDNKMLEAAVSSDASAFIIPGDLKGRVHKPCIVSENPMLSFVKALEVFNPPTPDVRGVMEGAVIEEDVTLGEGVTIYPSAYISKGAKIGNRVTIFPGVFVGEDVEIGDDSVIYAGVVIRERVIIGNRVIIHPNAVIGADGFGYIPEGGHHHKIPQIGRVRIGDDVEIGANTTIDRATTGETVVGAGTKIDNLVQIAHNVKIGKNCIIVAQVGIAGSTKIGDNVTLAGQVGVSDHAEIESGTVVGAMSGVMGKLSRGVYLGAPARPHREFLRLQGLFGKLPELFKEIKNLRDELNRLKAKTEKGGKDV
ncbi:MAG: UDP-3-O-(3-hydroxymyristoyl)glucosamine N-acyltransferase [Nitrospirae bacterium]|nr:MAG: UDP-3-O-(3-hydroxymyristoyl)glucosamine N-acyltransferase [Nitrospirota bacterium]